MGAHRFLGHFFQPDTFDLRCRTGEILGDERSIQTDGLEDLRAAVRLVSRDAILDITFIRPC